MGVRRYDQDLQLRPAGIDVSHSGALSTRFPLLLPQLPFGAEIPRTDQADEPTKKYTGHERDPHGLADYMLGRTYLYPFMRFATPDVARDGWNLYAYTGGNPVNYVDPDGQESRAAVMLDQDARELLSGDITPQQYSDRFNARGQGGCRAPQSGPAGAT